ncbi:MAG: hypothetical protein N5P05_002678 [Chroococcopsis gigantea SAG 12.99]|nr:hypothetical protein [Chlorogloea purpurea SAG 13.99]MDV3001072.1 hypothetical protein [Chroococcopsis gigantea SAG 12.99]
MGIIYIGDRAVGKTSLAQELANPRNRYVKVTNLSYQGGKPQATDDISSTYEKPLQIQVELPTGIKSLMVEWIDTPGEIWRSSWQSNQTHKWESFLEKLAGSEGILLILPPYREILLPQVPDPDEYITQKQWVNRFDVWVDFFATRCTKVRHLLICLNMADLFISNLKKEAGMLGYVPSGSQMNWQQRDDYLRYKTNYFYPITNQINKLTKSIDGSSIRCFVTSIHNRELLELPWIYLATYLAK